MTCPVVTRLAALAAAALILLTGCFAANADNAAQPTSSSRPPVDSSSVQELDQPHLQIVYADADGRVRVLDLATETDSALAEIRPASETATDGRFFMAEHHGRRHTTVAFVDSGVWRVDHRDHSHYYRATPAPVSEITGNGDATVAADDTVITVSFADEGEARVLDREALTDGSVVELRRIQTGKNATLTPLGDGFVLTHTDPVTGNATLQALGPDGNALAGTDPLPCPALAGRAVTRVGAVFGCAYGVALATTSVDGVRFEQIPYPPGTASELRATQFSGRLGRPDVAAVAGSAGAWSLDTRARTWTLIPSEEPLITVSAVGGDAGLVVGVDARGLVIVLSAAERRILSTSEPVVPGSAARPETASKITLAVQASHAYLIGPAEASVFEIDYGYAGGISRTFPLPVTPVAAALVG